MEAADRQTLPAFPNPSVAIADRHFPWFPYV